MTDETDKPHPLIEQLRVTFAVTAELVTGVLDADEVERAARAAGDLVVASQAAAVLAARVERLRGLLAAPVAAHWLGGVIAAAIDTERRRATGLAVEESHRGS